LIFTPGVSLDRARDDDGGWMKNGWMKWWVHNDNGWMDEEVGT
jgi:hypothetical protein